MSSISLPVFEEKERLTHQKLNAAMNAIEARFAVGVGSAQLTWPMTAGDNLDMGEFFILGGRKFWDIVNAAEYDSLDAAVTAAGTNSIIFIPANTTVPCTSVVALPSGCMVIGAGRSSVIRRASNGNCLTLSESRNILANLRIEGDGLGIGVAGTNPNQVLFSNVWFDGSATRLVAVSGANSSIEFNGCHFTIAANAANVLLEGGNRVVFNSCTFDNTSASASIRVSNVSTVNLHVVSTTFTGTAAIQMLSSGSTNNKVWIDKCSAATGSIFIGEDSDTRADEVHITDCSALRVAVNASSGSIRGNRITATDFVAIQLHRSTGVVVSDNSVASTTTGVDVGHAACTNCNIHDNRLATATNPILHTPAGTRVHNIWGNTGVSVNAPTGNILAFVGPDATPLGARSGTSGAVCTITLPDILRTGSVIRFVMGGVWFKDPTGTAPQFQFGFSDATDTFITSFSGTVVWPKWHFSGSVVVVDKSLGNVYLNAHFNGPARSSAVAENLITGVTLDPLVLYIAAVLHNDGDSPSQLKVNDCILSIDHATVVTDNPGYFA